MPPTSDQDATDGVDPRSAAVTFVTTEHFVLQGARSATIAESNGRANMFLAAVSGGLVALGLVATASSLGAAFYGFGLVSSRPCPSSGLSPSSGRCSPRSRTLSTRAGSLCCAATTSGMRRRSLRTC